MKSGKGYNKSAQLRMLCLHQSAELYGSDRSFCDAIRILNTHFSIDVVLPLEGELTKLLRDEGVTPEVYGKGVLRRSQLSRPIAYFWEVCQSVRYWFRTFNNYDLVYINTIVILPALIASIFKPNVRAFCHVREIPSSFWLRFYRIIFRLSKLRLIFNSRATKMAFQLPGSVVYNGVEDLGIVPREKAMCVNFLLIGRINSWKGHQLLVDSLSALPRNARNRFHLNIVGSAPVDSQHFEKDLRRLVVSRGIDKNVSFFPFSSTPSEHFERADFVVVPSTNPEPFGRVAIEAFAAGRPVIAADHGGLSEIVSNDVNGFVFRPRCSEDLGRAILEAINLPSKDYLRLAHNARREFLARFSVSSYQNKILDILTDRQEYSLD